MLGVSLRLGSKVTSSHHHKLVFHTHSVSVNVGFVCRWPKASGTWLGVEGSAKEYNRENYKS
jgi:hypothetical protein